MTSSATAWKENFGRGSGVGGDGGGNIASERDQQQSTSVAATAASSTIPSPPTLSLPKGGGAIRAIGEKFDVNPCTGAALASIPIQVSSSRGALNPSLALTYNSSAGNGPFGLGWELSVPKVTRKTEKGLPQYIDGGEAESDVFIISEREDLVPLFRRDAQNNLVLRSDGKPAIDEEVVQQGSGYLVRRYSPRVEASFSRIERWTSLTDANDVYWRSTSPENVTTIFGKDGSSRIFDPVTGTSEPQRIFTWLVSEMYDSKGNAIVFEYKPEDSINVHTSNPNECNRTTAGRAANRYLKTIRYGNVLPNRQVDAWAPVSAASLPSSVWKFSIVFDYGEHDIENPSPNDMGLWSCRADPFSVYRSRFEVRTYRLCRRILMFHHFDELKKPNYLVSSTDLTYDHDPVATHLLSTMRAGYTVDTSSGSSPASPPSSPYTRQALPPTEFSYSLFPNDQELSKLVFEQVDADSLTNLPLGLDGTNYQWIDLDGEGLSGLLTDQGGSWYYKRNSSANNFVHGAAVAAGEDGSAYDHPVARLEPIEELPRRPSASATMGGQVHFGDVNGNGKLGLIQTSSSSSWGYFERTEEGDWLSLQTFETSPSLDINNSNVKMVDLTGDGLADILIYADQIFYWHPSLGARGYSPAQAATQPNNEEDGPTCVFADAEQTIYLADMSGDGLQDLVRVRNSDVVYWPNTGYGTFGALVRMANAPVFEPFSAFSEKRLRLADVDGSGAVDLLYFRPEAVDLYLNLAGNGFSSMKRLSCFPPVQDASSLSLVDLLGNGTLSIVWSSGLPGDTHATMKYIDIMRGKKPHLLEKISNNLGAERHIHYSPSTRFYLDDKKNGTPWVTRLPFPVHCVERLETFDYISDSYFVTRYSYHHGYFDGVEREFRGFGMVEQWDTEQFAALKCSSPGAQNVEETFYTPPTHTKTWFHTGALSSPERVAHFMGKEYFGAPPADDASFGQYLTTLLPSSMLFDQQMSGDELREACRSLKGSMLRQEVYADDNSTKSNLPYSTTERSYNVRFLQPRGDNVYAVFATDTQEILTRSYERSSNGPRTQHDMVLEVDIYGNHLRSMSVAYGRQPGLTDLQGDDKVAQEGTLIIYSENDLTNPVDTTDDYRTPLPAEKRTYEISGLAPNDALGRFNLASLKSNDFATIDSLTEIPFEQSATGDLKQKRCIQCTRILYRSNDLTRLLPRGQLESMSLPGESYKLSLTAGVLQSVFKPTPDANVTFDPVSVLPGKQNDKGGYVDLDNDGNWWVPSGRVFYQDTSASPNQELTEAKTHFFMPRRYVDAFDNKTVVDYDPHMLHSTRLTDALNNVVEASNDYRVLQPRVLTDPNGNRTEVAFDALGAVTGTAVMGKMSESLGDSLTGFKTDLSQAEIDQFFANPRGAKSVQLLGTATSRTIYDVCRYWRTSRGESKKPAFSARISRETHSSDLQPGVETKIQVHLTYSDGSGREIQKKNQAEPGPLDGQDNVARWVCSEWIVFNNKGQPVQRYEPFFDNTADFTFANKVGVASTTFYDAIGRAALTVHPNHTWEKTVYDTWQQTSYDVNDTALVANPTADPDVGVFFAMAPEDLYLPTWYGARASGQMGKDAKTAAEKVVLHADTPTTTHLDPLGRTLLTVANNGTSGKYETHVKLDIQSNKWQIIDAKGRSVMRYHYDMLGGCLHTDSMESGERWTLSNVAGKTLMSWNSRNVRLRNSYDPLQRPSEMHSLEGSSPELLITQFVYGESQQDPATRNLRLRTIEVSDQAGVLTMDSYDFKGNLLRTQRQLAQNYTTAVDWSGAVPLETEAFVSSSVYDALNRPIEQTSPDSSVIRPLYNDTGLLDRLDVNLLDEQANDQQVWTPFITNIDYDAKGQRVFLQYGNGASVVYDYDPVDHRLIRLQILREGSALLDCGYTYDPVGNVVNIRDNAQSTVFFRNRRVDPTAEYTYDAIYRLIQASGREHLGQVNGVPGQPSVPGPFDSARTRLSHPGDGNAMGTYLEEFAYDQVGNLLSTKHRGSDPSAPGWTRSYRYDEASLIEPGKMGNLLSSTSVGSMTESYSYDANGNMTKMPHLNTMQWDPLDRLRTTVRQVVTNGGTPEMTYYVYDSSGKRVRKVTERQTASGQSPTRLQERVYLDNLEVFRQFSGSEGSVALARETLHISDDQQRIALVETKTQSPLDDDSPGRLVRYQFSNYLGSAYLEVDDQAQVISYEEYYPYGSTSYQAVRSQTETPKRYRYTGKERDEESGLGYHDARYYAPWLGRWTAPDPATTQEASNRYQYSHSNPIRFNDISGKDPVGRPGQDSPQPSDPSSYNTLADWLHSQGINRHSSISNPQKADEAYRQWYKAHPEKTPTITTTELKEQLQDSRFVKQFINPSDPKVERINLEKITDTEAKTIVVIIEAAIEASKASKIAPEDLKNAIVIGVATSLAESNLDPKSTKGNRGGIFMQPINNNNTDGRLERQARAFYSIWYASKGWRGIGKMEFAIWYMQGSDVETKGEKWGDAKKLHEIKMGSTYEGKDLENWLDVTTTSEATRRQVRDNFRSGIGLGLMVGRILERYGIPTIPSVPSSHSTQTKPSSTSPKLRLHISHE